MKEYKIKINYPSNWTRMAQDPDPQTKVRFLSPAEDHTDRVLESVKVDILDKIGNMTLDTLIEKAIKNLCDDQGFKVIETNPTTLSGVPAHQIIFSSTQIKGLMIATIKDNIAYSIMYTAEPNKYLKFLSSAEQMINSFEFL